MDQQRASELSRRMMKKQLRLSLSVAAVFVIILVGLPLVNLYLPDLAKTKVAGFTLTWLILGVLFFPLTWVLSSWFVKGTERIDAEIVAEESK
jgi:uncharacterized membrane protein YbhN (UPF0104 family)